MQLLILMSCVGCASYRAGYIDRELPGGYDRVSIPVFSNETELVGVETYFTNQLRRQFNRSKVAKVVKRTDAPVELKGSVRSISFIPGGQVAGTADTENNQILLPDQTVLTTEYRVVVVSQVTLQRKSDGKVLWRSEFTDEKVYTVPQLGVEGVNSANALYNHSARHQAVEELAKNMMVVVHDQMTENF